MVQSQRHYLTEEGLKEVEERLNFLRTVRRQEVAQRLHNALAEGGELGEDAEYEDAKNEQAFVEGEIARLEEILSKVVLIDENRPKDIVGIGSRVKLREKGTDLDEEYLIVGEAEADPSRGKISYKSPLGQALMNHKVKDTVKVQAPDGELSFSILSIE
ncbi:MAG: transcription elongation factor GreA [Anaerolineae bacterium]|nr:MAG: transcription elongation factor GreA [Anaerolineae bacterium]MCL4877306.1 transcription elongation factor GreA [Anaerolineae bacterium]